MTALDLAADALPCGGPSSALRSGRRDGDPDAVRLEELDEHVLDELGVLLRVRDQRTADRLPLFDRGDESRREGEQRHVS